MIFPYSQDVKIIITNFVWHILFCTKHTSNNITQENKTNIAYAVALSIYCVITTYIYIYINFDLILTVVWCEDLYRYDEGSERR
jgi:hypothetical protein